MVKVVVAVLFSRKILSTFRTLLFQRCSVTKNVRMAFSDVAVASDGNDSPAATAAVQVFRQALATFPPSDDFHSRFQKLKKIMDGLKAEDFGLDPIFGDPAMWKKRDKPPCTFIKIFQNQDINMVMFVLAPGYKMPLHDHPHMHGLLKVIKGSVYIRSFTEQPLTENHIKEVELEKDKKFKRKKLFVSCKQVCNESSPTCILTPTDSNLHEIQALHEPAAFLDVLSPPYDDRDLVSDRSCHYYRVINELSPHLVELQEIDSPDDYYCDQAPYLGPLLS